MDKAEKQQIPFKQELINHLIWLFIINGVFAYFGNQMEKGSISSVGQIIWFISGFFLFGFLFAFTQVLKRKYKNTILSFIVALVIMLAVNFVLLALF